MKKCEGTNKQKGCGKEKPDNDFSLSYKSMCKECEREYKRLKYHREEHPHLEGTAIYNQYATKKW